MEATGMRSVSPPTNEGSPGRIAPMASDKRSVPEHPSEQNLVEKHNPFTAFTKNPAADRINPTGILSTHLSPFSQYSPASNGKQLAFSSAGEVRQQRYNYHDSNPDKRQLFSHTGSVVEGALGTSRNPSRTTWHSPKEHGGAVGCSEILEDQMDAPILHYTRSPHDKRDDDQQAVTPASSLTPRLNAAQFSGALLAQTTDEPRYVPTLAKRGRPRKPQLPRPGDQDFIGPLNRRGRKSTGDFVPETAGSANNRNLEHWGELHTPHNGTIRKHGSSGNSRNVYSTEPPLAAVPILVQLAGGDDTPRKLQIRYRASNLRMSTSGHNAPCMLEVDCEGMSRRRANALIALFKEFVYPFIQSLTNHYRGFHTDEDLRTMGLDVGWLLEG